MDVDVSDVDAWGSWEDDNYDEFLVQTTQDFEEEEERRHQEIQSQNGSRESSGSNMTPNLAAQVFNSRRENLPQDSNFQPVPAQIQISESAAVSQLLYANKQYTAEKEKTRQLTDQIFAAQGEIGNLRRQVEALKQAQQEELICRIRRETDDRQRYEKERRELNQKLQGLQTQCHVLKNENSTLKTKHAIIGSRAVGGAQQTIKPFRSQASLATSPAPKPRSAPNLHTSLQQSLSRSSSVQPVVLSEVKQPKVEVAERGTQVNAAATEQIIRDEDAFSGASADAADEVRISSLDNIASLKERNESIRRKMFQTMDQLIKLDLKYKAKDVIESIVTVAPKEIMARFTRGVELQNCFPDLIENMFLYGIQVQQRRENAERVQKRYPKLPSALNSPVIDLLQFYNVLESSFVHNSAWLALSKVKKQLQELLSGLVGQMRFRLYESRTLTALWELLAWAKYLWRFITFEEEFEEIVEMHGKKEWIDELKSWTGLILKIDWRDFYVLQLETLVREFSLSILEIIVTTGYFDSSQRRYEILYCILKDTLFKDYLRNEQTLTQCLSIITWSISDNGRILNYLCINNHDGNCLARILGENVLKCFNELKSNHKATALLLHYFHLLENLMVPRPARCFSNIACPPKENRYEDSENEGEDIMDAQVKAQAGSEAMEVDLMCSQFACTEKYKFEDGSTDRAKRFNNVSVKSCCWINPVEWEVPLGGLQKPEDGPCQCRKVLLGSAFIMFYRVVEWWKESIAMKETEVERRESLEMAELQKLKETFDEEEGNECVKDMITQLSTKLASLQTYIIEVSNDNNAESADDEVLERKWNLLLNNWKLPDTLASDQCGLEKKHTPLTIFDLAVRSGILLINFCNLHSQNMALSAGSEAFNCFTQLISDAKLFENLQSMTEAEKRALMEIMAPTEDENQLPKRKANSGPLTDDEDDDDDETSCVLLPNEDYNFCALHKQFPVVENQRNSFKETDFDRAFALMEK